MLTRRPTSLPSKPSNDFEILDEDRNVIGRIHFTVGAPAQSPPWFWGITTVRPNLPGRDRGFAMTLEDAMAAFKAVWEKRAP